MREVAANAARQKDARDEIAVIVALRDYVRQHVGARDFSPYGRPLLRHTAAETLRSGKGFCGEGTRVFVNLADTFGIRAQRLYLEGRQPHVVALVTLKSGEQVIADSWEKPFFAELESLARFSQQSEFNYYSSFNRAKLPVSPPPNTISLGRLAYYLENPHALQASLCFGLIAGALAVKLVRRRLRRKRLTPPRETRLGPELSEDI